MLRLICDSSTILFFTATKNRDKVTGTETQITLDALHYYEDDTGSAKPNFAQLGSRISRQRGKRQKTIKGIVRERELQLSVSGLIYNSYFIVMSWQDLFNFSLLFNACPSHFSCVLPDLLSLCVCLCLFAEAWLFRPLSSVAAHAWHHIHFLDASQEEEVMQWSMTEKDLKVQG